MHLQRNVKHVIFILNYLETSDVVTMSIIVICSGQGNISSRFSSKSEASASELLENLEDMFPQFLVLQM